VNVFKGTVDVFKGTVGVYKGTIGVFKGTVGVFKGTVDVFKGTVDVFKGTVDVFKRTVDVISNSHRLKSGMSDLQRYPLKRCLTKKEWDIYDLSIVIYKYIKTRLLGRFAPIFYFNF